MKKFIKFIRLPMSRLAIGLAMIFTTAPAFHMIQGWGMPFDIAAALFMPWLVLAGLYMSGDI